MNDIPPPIDDEVVSAVLDGEATAAERALVEGSPEGRARLEELRRAAAAVAGPVEPLDAPMADELVGRALAARPGAAPAPDELAARRARRGVVTRRALGAVAAVAAVVLVALGLADLGGGDGTERAGSGGSAYSVATDAEGATDALAGAAASVPDLRSAEDPDVLLGRLSALVTSAAGFDHTFDDDVRGSVADEGAPSEASTAAPACTAPVPGVDATTGWQVVAIGRLPSGPVVVVTDGPPAAGGLALVLDASSCEVLGEGAI